MNSGIQKTDGLSKLQHQEPPDNTHGGFLGISSGFLTKPPGNLQEAPIAFICGIVHKVAPLWPNAYNNTR